MVIGMAKVERVLDRGIKTLSGKKAHSLSKTERNQGAGGWSQRARHVDEVRDAESRQMLQDRLKSW